MDIVDIATRDYIEVDSEERLGKVRFIFDAENPKGVIVTRDGEYAGVVTERQMLQSHIEDSSKVAAMVKSAPKVARDEDVREVSRMLVEGGTKVAPVFEENELWGIVTVDAILNAVVDNLDALTVEQIYTDDVVFLEEDSTLGQAINRLREHGISRLPVVDGDGSLSGMVTTHDIVAVTVRGMDKSTRGERAGDIDRVLDLPVYDIMNSPVRTLPVTATTEEAVRLMLEHDIGGVVITPVDDDRTIDGVITKTDVLRALTFTEADVMDVQVTNVDLLDTLTRESIRDSLTKVVDKFSEMQVHHVQVRFQKHKEKLRGTPLIHCQIRVRSNQGQVAGTGEGYGADHAFHVALDKLERNVLELKGLIQDETYEGQLLRKLGEL